ncbi:MAG: nitrogen fixation protein NifX [Candidatus Acididesulfobacter diazotrophicus]|jgi:nitrogen fixation protein NifX|uniref:Nitrogen fixation protein NifX n=1 Tax=Candidatus Acididesulfobacter diazotrophicus TaxID=2597226 RepID=A0A519BKZ3_9DELT|nr:MAG: nitrogen fixation protein NifX [Candidatus Acididesulfobacter diazotrophicus]
MKVGFATTDNVFINDHFGWAKKIAVYDVTESGFDFIGLREFEEEEDETEKIDKKIAKLRDLKIIFVESIGGTAAAKVVSSGIHPVKSKPDDKIVNVLENLREVLSKNPPPWLKKIVMKEKTANMV